MTRITFAMIVYWLLSFVDVNNDNKLTFMDLSVLVAGVIFTLKMLGWLAAAPDDPALWTVFMVSIASLAGITKVVEALKR